jgi:serine/threonine protein phosphatase 1
LLESGLNVECLIGNHERLFLDASLNINNLNQWLLNGGDKTLASFLTSSIEKIPKKYFDLIKSFKYYKEESDYILVHAAINMKIENPFSDIQTLIWERDPIKYFDETWLGNRKIIHGHSPKSQKNIIKSISDNEKIICIDNGTFLKKEEYGSLCILQLENLNPIFIK